MTLSGELSELNQAIDMVMGNSAGGGGGNGRSPGHNRSTSMAHRPGAASASSKARTSAQVPPIGAGRLAAVREGRRYGGMVTSSRHATRVIKPAGMPRGRTGRNIPAFSPTSAPPRERQASVLRRSASSSSIF